MTEKKKPGRKVGESYGPMRKSILCYNTLINDKMSCEDCDRLKLKPRKCIASAHGVDCNSVFTPTCTRRFICYECHAYNKLRSDIITYGEGR